MFTLSFDFFRIKEFESLFEANFTKIGMGAVDGKGLIKESQSNWKYYASGRKNCEGLNLDSKLFIKLKI